PFVDRPVVDMTELKGTYQVALELSMQEMMSLARARAPELGIPVPPGPGGPGAPGIPGGTDTVTASDPGGSSMFAAVQQLGLKLEPRKAPVQVVVVDHIEKTPTEN